MHCSRSRCPSLGHRAPQITPGSAMKISLPQCSWESLFDPVQCGRGVWELTPAAGYFTLQRGPRFYILHQPSPRFTQNPGNLNIPQTVQADGAKGERPKNTKKTNLVLFSTRALIIPMCFQLLRVMSSTEIYVDFFCPAFCPAEKRLPYINARGF